MIQHNLTRATALARSEMLQTQSYSVLVDLSGLGPQGNPLADPERTFVASSTVKFTTNGGESHIDLIAAEVLYVSLDQTQIEAHYDGGKLHFTAEAGEHELTVVSLMRFSRTGEGLHRFIDPADGKIYLYSQFELADARRMFACFDQPDLKATWQLSVLGPEDWIVISKAPTPEPAATTEGLARWDFPPSKPMSTYVMALVAGNYHVDHGTITSGGQSIGANIQCRQSSKEYCDADRIRLTAQRGFEVFESSFGMAYPFEKYDQVFVPEFNAGAMENAGCVTFRDDLLYRSRATAAEYDDRDNTVLHELAHMWFGDLVTMKWWDDLWLNESFAEWASHFAQAEIAKAHETGVNPWASFCSSRKNWAYHQDQLPTTHPITTDMVDLEAVELNFDGITYAKGASALNQLVAYVGLDEFIDAIRSYFMKHAWGNTQLKDLLAELTETSGRELDSWADAWLAKAGVNSMRLDIETDAEGVITKAVVHQYADAQNPTLRPHRMAIGCYRLAGDTLDREARIELDVTDSETEVPDLVGTKKADLTLLNDDDLSYTKVRLDEGSLATLTEHMAKLPTALTRALCWGATWDMCRDAELSPEAYIDIAIRGLGSETDLTAVRSILRQTRLASIRYTNPEEREQARSALVSGLATLLKHAEPGSDHQLAFAQALARAVHTSSGVGLLQGWLVGLEVPEGLKIDTELRWLIVTELARMGAMSQVDIEAELAQDKTIQGKQWAAAALAARPVEGAKEEAWDRCVNQPDIPNETHRRIAAAFVQADQEELLLPYRDRYLELADAIGKRRDGWADRSSQIQITSLRALFPSIVADHEFLARVNEWLGSEDISDGARRVVAECADDAARALRCQER